MWQLNVEEKIFSEASACSLSTPKFTKTFNHFSYREIRLEIYANEIDQGWNGTLGKKVIISSVKLRKLLKLIQTFNSHYDSDSLRKKTHAHYLEQKMDIASARKQATAQNECRRRRPSFKSCFCLVKRGTKGKGAKGGTERKRERKGWLQEKGTIKVELLCCSKKVQIP